MKGRELEAALIEALDAASKDADQLGVGFIAIYADGRPIHDGTSYAVAALDPRTVTIGTIEEYSTSYSYDRTGQNRHLRGTAPEIEDARPTPREDGVRAFPDIPTFVPATEPTKWRCSPHGNTVIQDTQPTINCKDSDRAGCEWSRV